MDNPHLPTVEQVLDANMEGAWAVDNRYGPEVLGFLPMWVTADAETSMIEQIHENYSHGGGWHDFAGFVVDHDTGAMHYPGDPIQWPIALMVGETEVLWLYPGSWVTVMRRDTKICRTARID
jgi:hypothetical protein